MRKIYSDFSTILSTGSAENSVFFNNYCEEIPTDSFLTCFYNSYIFEEDEQF